MSKNNSILGFIIGAALGSVITWAVSKSEYEKRMNEELKTLRKRPEEEKSENDISENESVEDDANSEEKDKEAEMMEYARKIKENKYTNYENASAKSEEEKVRVDKPYVISPEEFGELDDYDKFSLILYSDGVLTDEDDNVVDDVENTVGHESLNTFGQYEDDSVYVRNDALKHDYEILLDERRYRDIKRPKI